MDEDDDERVNTLSSLVVADKPDRSLEADLHKLVKRGLDLKMSGWDP